MRYSYLRQLNSQHWIFWIYCHSTRRVCFHPNRSMARKCCSHVWDKFCLSCGLETWRFFRRSWPRFCRDVGSVQPAATTSWTRQKQMDACQALCKYDFSVMQEDVCSQFVFPGHFQNCWHSAREIWAVFKFWLQILSFLTLLLFIFACAQFSQTVLLFNLKII